MHKFMQGFFPWFASQEKKAVISRFRDQRDQLQEKVNYAQTNLLYSQRDANKQLGLFSAHGVDQVKSRFWYVHHDTSRYACVAAVQTDVFMHLLADAYRLSILELMLIDVTLWSVIITTAPPPSQHWCGGLEDPSIRITSHPVEAMPA